MDSKDMGLGSFKKYEISIKGVTPLVWNRMKRELELEKGKLKKDQLTEWEEKNWLRKAEFDDSGGVVLPNEWLKKALMDSASKSKIVPHYARSKNQTYSFYMQSMMVEVDNPICVKKDLKGYGAYVNGNPSSMKKSKVWRVRPLLEKGWRAKFSMTDPEGRMKKSELEVLLRFAGYMVGIGDNRINNFGRFDVLSVKEVAM
jgi:predicted HNH restriction endonuclease